MNVSRTRTPMLKLYLPLTMDLLKTMSKIIELNFYKLHSITVTIIDRSGGTYGGGTKTSTQFQLNLLEFSIDNYHFPRFILLLY